MRTYKCTVVTLNTCIRIPYRNGYCSTTFFISGSSCYELTICNISKCGYRKAVTIHLGDRLKKLVDHINNLFTSCLLLSWSIWCRIFPRIRNFYFVYSVNTGINCLVVHLYDSVTLLRIRLLSCLLHELNSFIDRHNVC